MLSTILPSIATVITKQHIDDDLSSEDDDAHDWVKTKSVVKHTKFPERVFAYLDHLMKSRPNSTSIANEATMFSLNQTGKWLESVKK